MKPSTYLNITLAPRGRSGPIIAAAITKRSVRAIEPSVIFTTEIAADGTRRHGVHALGYDVTYREGRQTRRARTTADDLRLAGLPVPAMPQAEDYRPSRRS